MPHLSTAEKIGRDIGREIGRGEGKAELLMYLIDQRFGSVSEQVGQSIHSLSASQLNEFGLALLDFTSVSEIETWLEARRTKR